MKKVLPLINRDHIFVRMLLLLVGTFFGTLTYNMFLVPNNLVVGGVSGLAIIIKELTGLSTTLFINGCNVILVIMSFILVGKKKTVDQLIGTVVYLLMLNVTSPIAERIGFAFSSEMLMLVFTSIVWGVAMGLIYRPGYSTGGSDFLATIISDKIKRPITSISLIIQVGVILAGAIVFSIPKVMGAIFIIYVSNKITNMIMFGVSTSKLVYVISDANDEIENYIMNEINTGATEIKVHSGLFEKRRQMLMCVVHNAQYAKFKENVLKLDPNAFMMSNNCYEVSGGQKYEILPF
ncbi:MAG TPA: hypothetical protein DCY94_02300 [Firmicutes bacterium]|nr:hypothetical protein [Bacillota bacterium]